jgi:hypothetical protein
MALLGQHIVEMTRTRLAGLWQPARHSRAPVLHFKSGGRVGVDASSLDRAHRLYAGTEVLTAEQFLSLEWLSCFARSGRQLLMCHALRLLEGWDASNLPLRSLDEEAQQLEGLANTATSFASTLHADQLATLMRAFDTQLARLAHVKTRTASEQLTKALALLSAARALYDSSQLERDALRLLDQALPLLVSSDGGPLSHSLVDYLSWINPLLLQSDLPFAATTRSALDRARPFLAMLLDADQSYVVNRTMAPVADVLKTSALRLAPTSQVVRAAGHKTVVIALPGQLTEHTSLDMTRHGQRLAVASLFLHDGREDQSVTFVSHKTTEQGQLMVQETASTSRMIFLSPRGDDLRIEDQWSPDNLKRWMRLDVSTHAKISISRNGTLATIALDGRNLWQLSLRGARLLPLREEGLLFVETNEARVNWAFRRVARVANKVLKDPEPELPF